VIRPALRAERTTGERRETNPFVDGSGHAARPPAGLTVDDDERLVPELVYLPPSTDEERKRCLDDGYTYERMKQFLLANWEDFADLYIQQTSRG